MLVVLCASASGKSLVTGSVLNAHHAAVPAAHVSLTCDGQKEPLTTQTDATGAYRFSVPPGKCTLHAESDSLGDAVAGPFTVAIDKTMTVDLVLRQAEFFDEPQFTVAGVTDNTYRGGHGSDTVLRSAEDLAKATASLGETVEHPDDPIEAVREMQRAAESNPSEPNLFAWGTELLSHRAPHAAAAVFTKGTKLFPRSMRMLLGLATAWYAEGSYGKAAQCFFSAADLDPNDPNPCLFLGKVQAREITQASGYTDRMERFAALQPGNARANYYYAVNVWDRRSGPGDNAASAKARTLLDKAITLDPTFGAAYLELGIVYAGERKYPEAIHEYLQAIAVSPESEEGHYRLSEAYRLTGDRIDATRELAVYNRLSKESAGNLERERRAIQQFVIELRNQPSQ